MAFLVQLGSRTTLVDVGGIPNQEIMWLKFNMPGCGCKCSFKATLVGAFEKVDVYETKKDVMDFVKLFLLGKEYTVNFCTVCGRSLPKI
jgi:hypothetical protein